MVANTLSLLVLVHPGLITIATNRNCNQSFDVMGVTMLLSLTFEDGLTIFYTVTCISNKQISDDVSKTLIPETSKTGSSILASLLNDHRAIGSPNTYQNITRRLLVDKKQNSQDVFQYRQW